MDGGRLRTFLCDPMHMLRSSGYTLSGIYNDDLSWSPRRQLPENAFSLIYTIPHTNSRLSAGVHTLAKKSCFSSLFGSHPPDYVNDNKFHELLLRFHILATLYILAESYFGPYEERCPDMTAQDRDLCPYWLLMNISPTRYPRILPYARCRCEKCRGKPGFL